MNILKLFTPWSFTNVPISSLTWNKQKNYVSSEQGLSQTSVWQALTNKERIDLHASVRDPIAISSLDRSGIIPFTIVITVTKTSCGKTAAASYQIRTICQFASREIGFTVFRNGTDLGRSFIYARSKYKSSKLMPKIDSIIFKRNFPFSLVPTNSIDRFDH